MYADFLLKMGRYKDALSHYELTLNRAPNRIKALEGIEKAKTATNSSNLSMAE